MQLHWIILSPHSFNFDFDFDFDCNFGFGFGFTFTFNFNFNFNFNFLKSFCQFFVYRSVCFYFASIKKYNASSNNVFSFRIYDYSSGT